MERKGKGRGSGYILNFLGRKDLRREREEKWGGKEREGGVDTY